MIIVVISTKIELYFIQFYLGDAIMNITEKIKQEFDTMTKSERQVASYFLGHINDFTFYTLDRVADEIGISTTSVIRFCRKIGFAGFKEFQDTLRGEVKYQPSLPAKFQRTLKDSIDNDLLAQTLQQEIRCLEKTFSEMSNQNLADAVQLISSAQRVFSFGLKESYALAHYAYTRFLTVRDNAFMLGIYNSCIEAILSLTPEDVCLVFLFHRYTKETLHILPMLKAQGVPIILVTSAPYDELLPYATILLHCYVDAHGIKNTSLAPICLLDYLCNAVAVQKGEDALIRMKQLESLIQTSDILGS